MVGALMHSVFWGVVPTEGLRGAGALKGGLSGTGEDEGLEAGALVSYQDGRDECMEKEGALLRLVV